MGFFSVWFSVGMIPLPRTDPFAFACPRQGKSPMGFDFATSASARGEIQVARVGLSALRDRSVYVERVEPPGVVDRGRERVDVGFR